ncbi:MAG: secretin N-terminal domain-containing protein [Kiritimatiellia bacterium]|nr:secretin N-terminal domain-containing protein [Kiritimatiellia bacterium]
MIRSNSYLMKFAALAMVVAVLSSSWITAQEDVGPKRLSEYNLPGMDKKVNLTSFEPMDIVQLIEYLSHLGGLSNIVIAKDVAGTTAKLRFDDASVADALETVLSVNQLAYEVRGGILTIMTDAEYERKRGSSFYDQKQTKVVILKYADPSRVAKLLEPVASGIGKVVFDSVTGSLILVDTPEKINEMSKIVAASDIATVERILPTETKTFTLKYAELEDIKPEVEGLLTKEAGKLRSDARTRTLIVTDLPHSMQKIDDMIALFDARPKQVFIESKIVEVALDDTYSLGINWAHFFEGIDPRFSVSSISDSGAITEPSLSLSYNTIAAGGDLSVVLEALKSVGETKILSNPQVAVIDGQEARIEVIEDQPYKEVATQGQLEDNDPEDGILDNIVGVTYLFKKVGVQLAVTPRINEENMINVAVRPEISSISQWYDGDPQEGTPVVKQAVAETTVLVRDSVTIIIGGLIKDRVDKTTKSVPLLGDIPLLGRLFRHDTVSKVNTETILFLTPRIITGEEPNLRLRDEKKQPKLLKTNG